MDKLAETASVSTVARQAVINVVAEATTKSVFYALIRVVLASGFLLLQLATVPVFVLHAEFRRLICYRIMFAIGLCDICQLFVEASTLTLAICGVNFGGGFVEKAIGAVYALSWDMLFVLILILALNRMVIIVKAVLSPGTSNYQPPLERIVFNILFVGAALFFVAGVGFYLSPWCGVYFNGKNFAWSYNRTLPYWELARTFEYSLSLVCPLVAFVIYVAIVCLIKVAPYIDRIRSSPPQPSSSNNGGGPKQQQQPPQSRLKQARRFVLMAALEYRILVQSSVMFVLLATGTAVMFPVSSVLSPLAMLAYDCWNLLVCGINPIMYLAMNPSFRHRVLSMLGFQRDAAVAAVPAISNLHNHHHHHHQQQHGAVPTDHPHQQHQLDPGRAHHHLGGGGVEEASSCGSHSNRIRRDKVNSAEPMGGGASPVAPENVHRIQPSAMKRASIGGITLQHQLPASARPDLS